MSTIIKFRINGHDWAYCGESQGLVDMIETLAERRSLDFYEFLGFSDATVYFIEDDDDREYIMDPEDASNLRHIVFAADRIEELEAENKRLRDALEGE